MSYRVIKFFTDLQDHNRPYHVGDVFPRMGLTVSDMRLEELSSSGNKRGVPLIEKVNANEKFATVEVSKPAEDPFMNEQEFADEPVAPKKRGRKPKNAE